MNGLPFKEAIEFLRQRLALGEAEWEQLIREVDAAARARSRAMSLAMHEDLLRAVLQSIEEGGTAQQFRDAFDQIAKTHGWTGDNVEGWRSALIFRTQTAQAQAAGRWRQIEKNKARFPYLRYVTVGDHRVRPAHAAWHNLVLRADDPWWKTHFPPNGFNCRCRVVQIDERDLVRYKLEVGEAPPLNRVTKIIKTKTGYREVLVPAGIDPGFAYNAGEVGLQLPEPVR